MSNGEIKSKVKPIYLELQGQLSQAPLNPGHYIYTPLWKQLENCISELNEVTGDNFDKYKVTISFDNNEPRMTSDEYRTQLGSLIMRLYGIYFIDETAPFSGTPSTIVNQTQNQSQNAQIIMIMDIQTALDKQLNKPDLTQEEKTFLGKVKEALPTIKTSVDLVNLVLSTANSLGFDPSKALKALGL